MEQSQQPLLVSRPWKTSEVQASIENPILDLTVMHWNMLADKLADDYFPKVPEDYLKWSHRFPLILQQIKSVDPDVIGLSEVDCFPLYDEVRVAMYELGYLDYFYEKSNRQSAPAVFYKRDKFSCLKQNLVLFEEKASQFLIYTHLQSKADPKTEFVFAETHLKSKAAFIEQRTHQTKVILDHFTQNYKDIPIFIAGDFNETPENVPIT